MRRSMALRGAWLLAGSLLVCPGRLAAAPLPTAARAMLTEAYPKERQAVVNVLKRLYPGSTDEIDSMVRQIADEKKLQVEQMGLIQGLRGEVSIGGYYSTGNTKEWGASGTIAVRHEGKRWVNAFDATADIKTEDGQRTTERFAANYHVRRNFEGSRWFAAAGLRYDRDPFAGLSRRFGQFVAPGYQLLNSEQIKWDVLAGPGFRETRYVDGVSERQFGVYGRTTFAWQLTDTLKFGEEFSAAVGKGNDSFLSNTSLTTDLYGNFALRFSVGAEYETRPPPDREKLDTYSKASVVYMFQPH